MSDQDRKNKTKLLIIILVPFILMLVAWGVFYSGIGMPSGTSNKGLLINPPMQLNDVIIDGAPNIVEQDNFNWFFLLPGGSSCFEACQQRLYLTRQIRTALGKHTHKIQRLYLLDEGIKPDEAFEALIQKEHPDLKLTTISRSKLAGLLANTSAAERSPEQGYYLADFRGFIMMYYGEEHIYKDTMKDVKYLLKYAP